MNKGFTLIELLIVIALVAVVAGLVTFVISDVRDLRTANYEITHDGHTYYVEAYTKENQGQCVFLAEKELRLCGDWSVEKLDKDK